MSIEPVDEATLIEQRRKRREAIKAKYRDAPKPLIVQALKPVNPPESVTNGSAKSTSNADETGKVFRRSIYIQVVSLTSI